MRGFYDGAGGDGTPFATVGAGRHHRLVPASPASPAPAPAPEPASSSSPASSPAPVPGAIAPGELIAYLADLGGALLSYGCATHRLERLLAEIALMEGYVAEAFAVPTGLFLSLVGPGIDQPLVRMHRVKDWATDLMRLSSLDALFNDVLARRVTLAQARRVLDEIEARPPLYPRILGVLASTGTAGAAAVFFRGGRVEIAVAALGGLLVGLVRLWLGRRYRTALLGDFIGAVIAAGLAWAACALAPDAAREVMVLAVVILLVPGMALTTGLQELVHKNLVSGAAKLMETLVIFLSIVFGIAVMVALEGLLGASLRPAPPLGEPGIVANAIALLVASAGFCVLFQVPRRLVPGAMLSGGVGWVVTALGVRHLPGSLSAFTAAFSVAVLANGVARLTRRPAQVFLLPGLVLLVPGSFGFISLEAFLRGDFLPGAAKGFEMFLTASAIVIGLVAADVVLPARKFL
jgi:uncharacterized membrane protein YjjP (DUF1212 family)